MIFLSRRPALTGNSSNREVCLSTIGLFTAIGLISGLATLIYGLVVDSRLATLIGAIILGVSALVCLLFVLLVIFCFKNASNPPHQHHHHRHSPRPTSVFPRPSSQQIVNPMPIHDDDPPISSDQQVFPSPTKNSTFTYLNQSHTSVMQMNFALNQSQN